MNAIPLVLPALGDDEGTSGEIINLVAVGTPVTKGDIYMEVETDKVVVEVPVETDGIISHYQVAVGDSVTGGDTVGDLTAQESSVAEASIQAANEVEALVESSPPNPAEADGPAVDTRVPASNSIALVIPALGDDETTSGEIISMVDAGTEVVRGDIYIEVETDKVVIEVPAETDGVISHYLVAVGDTVTGGDNIGEMTIDAVSSTTFSAESTKESIVVATNNSVEQREDVKTASNTVAAVVTSNSDATTKGEITQQAAAGPVARRLARKLGINIAEVPATGPKARITKEDVTLYAKQLISQKRQAPVPEQSIRALPDLENFGSITAVKMSGIGKATSRNMQHSWSEIPHAWVQEEINITQLEGYRKQLKQRSPAAANLTVTAILCKVVAMALKKFPNFNAVLDKENEQIVQRNYINIGVAVDTPRGLVVPGLRAVDGKSALQIADELKDLSGKAIASKLGAKDFQGNGFTLSNLGGLGVSGMFPVVNWPEVAILGVASSRPRCVFNNGQVSEQLVMPLTLGFDHRVINGADAARFLGFIKISMEQPLSLLIDG